LSCFAHLGEEAERNDRMLRKEPASHIVVGRVENFRPSEGDLKTGLGVDLLEDLGSSLEEGISEMNRRHLINPPGLSQELLH